MTQEATIEYRNPMIALDQQAEPVIYGLTVTAWIKIAVVAALMAATFRFNLLRLWLKTNPFFGEPNWRHAICVPLIGIYYLFVHRDELLETPVRTAWSGLLILLLGIVMFAYGVYPGQNDFVKDMGMITALFGVVALLCGWPMMKIAWFPIVFLICAIPWPELVYSYIASPLQRLAAKVAVYVLNASSVEAYHSGTKIIINAKGSTWRTLNVAEACAGLRSLMTFISVAAAIAFLSARPLWQKLVVTASAIPIAIFCNVMRVSGQGLLDHYVSQTWSEGFAHQFAGIVMLVPGFLFILFVGWLLDLVFVEVVDEREARRKRAALAPVAAPQWSLPGEGLAAEGGAGSAGVVKRSDGAAQKSLPGPVGARAAAPAAPAAAVASAKAPVPQPVAPAAASAGAGVATRAATPAIKPAVPASEAQPGAPVKPAVKPGAVSPVNKPPTVAPVAKPASPAVGSGARTPGSAPAVSAGAPVQPGVKPAVRPAGVVPTQTAAKAAVVPGVPAAKPVAVKAPVAPASTGAKPPVAPSTAVKPPAVAPKPVVQPVVQPVAPKPTAAPSTPEGT